MYETTLTKEQQEIYDELWDDNNHPHKPQNNKITHWKEETKEPDTLTFNKVPLTSVRGILRSKNDFEYDPLMGCVAPSWSVGEKERHMNTIHEMLQDMFLPQLPNYPADPDAPSSQYKMAMQYVDNYSPRRSGQKRGYR